MVDCPLIDSTVGGCIDQDEIGRCAGEITRVPDRGARGVFRRTTGCGGDLSGGVVVASPFSRGTFRGVNTGCRGALGVSSGNLVNCVSIPGVGICLPVCRNADRRVLSGNTKRLRGASLPINNTDARSMVSTRSNCPNRAFFSCLASVGINSRFCIRVLSEALGCRISRVRIILPSRVGSLQVISNRSLMALLAYAPCNIGARELLIHNGHISCSSAGCVRANRSLTGFSGSCVFFLNCGVPCTITVNVVINFITLIIFIIMFLLGHGGGGSGNTGQLESSSTSRGRGSLNNSSSSWGGACKYNGYGTHYQGESYHVPRCVGFCQGASFGQ